MKIYKVVLFPLIFLYVMLGLLTLVGIILWGRGFGPPGGPAGVDLFLVIWLAVLAWIWYFYLNIPITITWRDEGVLEFKSPLGTTVVPVSEVTAIKATPMHWGFLKVTYRSGSLRLLTQMTGLYELIGTVKAHNPEVQIWGC